MTASSVPLEASYRRTELGHRIAIWILFFAPIAATILALFRYFSWFGFFTFVILHFISGFGVTVGFHRLLTHESFKCKRWVYLTLICAGMTAVQGPCLVWTAVHRMHHKFSDRPGDPHSPNVGFSDDKLGVLKGFWHSHFGWLFDQYPKEELNKYIKRQLKDPTLVRLSELWWVWLIARFAVPALVGYVLYGVPGIWTGLAWSGAALFFVGHTTFSINSICHMYGDQPFKNDDESRNFAPLAFFTLGESYHHNHHVWEWMAFHGLTWRKDPSAAFIMGLIALGLAWDPRMPSAQQIEAQRKAAFAA